LVRCQAKENLLEISAFLQGVEPDESADDDDAEGIEDKGPVEDDEADYDVIGLYDSADGYCKGDEQSHTQSQASCEVGGSEHHVHEQVW